MYVPSAKFGIRVLFA